MRPRGGGGGKSTWRSKAPQVVQGAPAASPGRFNLTVSVNARNIFNNVNLATPIGSLTSPLFGQSNAMAGGGGRAVDPVVPLQTAAVYLQSAFTFYSLARTSICPYRKGLEEFLGDAGTNDMIPMAHPAATFPRRILPKPEDLRALRPNLTWCVTSGLNWPPWDIHKSSRRLRILERRARSSELSQKTYAWEPAMSRGPPRFRRS